MKYIWLTPKKSLMKKTATLLLLIAGFMLTSCKKHYVCYCTVVSTGQKIQAMTYKPTPLNPVRSIIDKRDFKKNCADESSSGGVTDCSVVKE